MVKLTVNMDSKDDGKEYIFNLNKNGNGLMETQTAVICVSFENINQAWVLNIQICFYLEGAEEYHTKRVILMRFKAVDEYTLKLI